MRAMLSALMKPKDLPVSGGYSRRPTELALQQYSSMPSQHSTTTKAFDTEAAAAVPSAL